MAVLQQDCDPDDPKQFMAWAVEAGVPDPRPIEGIPNQPLIPPQSAAAMSEMYWELGFRHHPELQKKWVIPGGFGTPGRVTARKPKTQKAAKAAKKGKKGKKQQLAPGIGVEQADEMMQDITPDKYEEVMAAKQGGKKVQKETRDRMLASALALMEQSKKIKVPDNLMLDSDASGNT